MPSSCSTGLRWSSPSWWSSNKFLLFNILSVNGLRFYGYLCNCFQVVCYAAYCKFIDSVYSSFVFTLTGNRICGGPTAPAVNAPARSTLCSSLYHDMQLEGVVNWEAFRQAVTGYYKISGRKKNILTLIDFSKPSTEKRLYVFDMDRKKLLFHSVVSHGKNSGGNYATSFPTNTAPTRAPWASISPIALTRGRTVTPCC